MTMQMEHDAAPVHLSTRMEDDSRHPYRVVMADGGATIIMPEDSWVQSIVLHGMPTGALQDTATMGRIYMACWEMAECCRSAMADMRMMMSTAGGGTSTGASGGGSSGSTGTTGQMATIVCESCTINLTL
jgi:uncharacterized membrane protein YgcG